MFTGMFNISDGVVWLIYYVILLDHRQHTRSRLLASTERSIAYRTTAWYITITAVLFVPPIFLVLLPLVLCPRLASIFDVADSQTISVALTALLAYICVLTFFYSTFQYRKFTIGINSLCSIYCLSTIPRTAPTIWFIPAPPIASSHTYLTYAS
jgi:hypothetical protein